ncbi:hypothetical protein EPO15_08300 [bacterium]|nr:MAG: hypothetical protein EPO15_08300 [bacterium]
MQKLQNSTLIRRLTLLSAILLCGAAAPDAWTRYRIRGTPFEIGLPPGAEFERRGPPRAVEDGRYTLREVYGEEEHSDGIVLPLRHGFLSAHVYRGPHVYATIARYLVKHRKSAPWGKSDRGLWQGMPTLTAGWKGKAVDGTPQVTVHYVVEQKGKGTLILELNVDEARLDEETPLFVKFKESLRVAGK